MQRSDEPTPAARGDRRALKTIWYELRMLKPCSDMLDTKPRWRQRPSRGNEVISKGDGKQVTAWSDKRNQAAHDPTNFDLTKPEVRLMIDGIRDFVNRTT